MVIYHWYNPWKKQPLQTSSETWIIFLQVSESNKHAKLIENNLCLVIQAVTFRLGDGENVSDLLRT